MRCALGLLLLAACGDSLLAGDGGPAGDGSNLPDVIISDVTAPDTSIPDAGCEALAGHKVCGGQCVDVMNDLNNCGTCGAFCPPQQACGYGVCVVPLGYSACVTVDAMSSSVLWTNGQYTSNGGGAVYKMPQGGGPITVIADKQEGAHGIAADGQFVFWTVVGTQANNFAGEIARANLDGSNLGHVIVGANGAKSPNAIAVDANGLYWSNNADQSLWRADKDGLNAVKIASTGGAYAIRVSQDYVYWSTYGGSLLRVKTDASNQATVVQGLTQSRGFWIDEPNSKLFIAASAIVTASTGGVMQAGKYIYGATQPTDTVSDGASVYWTTGSTQPFTVFKAGAAGGSNPQSLATSMNTISCLAMDATHLYYTTLNNAAPGVVTR